ncbi:pseudouridine synthase family protein isoform X1 [Wolffia australiana]
MTSKPNPAKKLRLVEGEEVSGGEAEAEERDPHSETSNMKQNPRIQRYLIAVEYIGTRFSGSQQQPNFRTVVGVLEDAFLKFIGQPVSIFCSSRTDAGVHALSNVCHVDVERISKKKPGEVLPPHEPGVVKRAVNHFLRKNEGDVEVVDVRCVPADFHSRFRALERTREKPHEQIFLPVAVGTRVINCVREGSGMACARRTEHSFHAEGLPNTCGITRFQLLQGSRLPSLAKSPIKTLEELHICEVPPSLYFQSIKEREQMTLEWDPQTPLPENNPREVHSSLNEGGLVFGQRKRNRCYIITARARSFLYHQVRLLVGVLKSVGTGELTTIDVKRILDAKTVTAAPPMAPACGLYLGNVKYDLP